MSALQLLLLYNVLLCLAISALIYMFAKNVYVFFMSLFIFYSLQVCYYLNLTK